MKEPAFPMNQGMTLREWYAGMALQGLLSRVPPDCPAHLNEIAEAAWHAADEMMKSPEKIKEE